MFSEHLIFDQRKYYFTNMTKDNGMNIKWNLEIKIKADVLSWYTSEIYKP